MMEDTSWESGKQSMSLWLVIVTGKEGREAAGVGVTSRESKVGEETRLEAGGTLWAKASVLGQQELVGWP